MKLLIKLSISVMIVMTFMPIQIFAHGTEDEHNKEIALTTYFYAGSTILFILFLVLFLVTRNKARQLQNAKKQEDRIKRQQLTKTASVLKWV